MPEIGVLFLPVFILWAVLAAAVIISTRAVISGTEHMGRLEILSIAMFYLDLVILTCWLGDIGLRLLGIK